MIENHWGLPGGKVDWLDPPSANARSRCDRLIGALRFQRLFEGSMTPDCPQFHLVADLAGGTPRPFVCETRRHWSDRVVQNSILLFLDPFLPLRQLAIPVGD